LAGEPPVLRLSIGGPVGRQLAARYGVRGVPTFVLLDGVGSVVHRQVGRLDAARVKLEIEALRR